MPRRVKGPDGNVHEFPDDATDHEISEALDAHPEKPARSWTDMAADALPAIGGTVGGVIGGLGGTVAGFGVGGVPGAIGGAALGGGAGEAARQLMNRWRGVSSPATPLEAAKDIAVEGGTQGAMEAAGGAVAKGLEVGGKAVYRGYLKPSLSASNLDKAREIVETGIANWLPVTKGGEAKAARMIGQLNAQVDAELKASGGSVDLAKIADRVRDFAKRTYFRPGSPTQDFDAAMKVADEIDRHPSLGLPAGANPTRVDVPVVQGNQVKQGLDRAVGDTGFGVERNAGTEARKVGRHEARLAIEAKVPGVGALNEQESKLIDALESIQKATGREENKNPLTGVSTILAMGAGGGSVYGATGDPVVALFTALAARGAITPTVATNAAIISAKLGSSKSFPYGSAAALRTALVLAARGENQSSEAKK